MWKVLVVVCALGNPCSMFVEDPIQYYNTEAECLLAAETKAYAIEDTFTTYGYVVDDAAHSCPFIFGKTEI